MPLQFSQDSLPITNFGECHVATVLLVDTSSSMYGAPITELNKGLVEFGDALQNDSLAQGRAEVCVISFNSSVQTEMSFRPAADYDHGPARGHHNRRHSPAADRCRVRCIWCRRNASW